MIRCAIVGIGGYGWRLVEAIREASASADCRLVAAADMDLDDLPERRASLLEEGVRLFHDALEMYRQMQDRVDIVYIATGIASHRMLTVQAARAGYHVHLEKPPAGTVQEVDEMLQALRENHRMCLVGFQAVHGRDIYGVKQRIVEGRLGQVRTLACHACWPRPARYYQRNEWAGKLRAGGQWVLDGPATNALAHQINNMLFWASPQAGKFASPLAVRAELYTAGDIESHNT
ncbi:MAG: Gfo/Idh/MocA family protein, partial [Planctomycetota bacterium]